MRSALGWTLISSFVLVVACHSSGGSSGGGNGAGAGTGSGAHNGGSTASGAACTAPTDCNGALPQFCEQCSDGTNACAHWSCESGACTIATCTSGDRDAGTGCKSTSDCKGPLPQVCAQCDDGTDQCAHFACVSGTCETQICEGHGGTGADAGPMCSTDTDCSGPLPQLCEVCSDGSSQCAHWVCTSAQCAVETCEANGGPKPVGNSCSKPTDCHGVLPDICEECKGGGQECAHWACVNDKCTIAICD